MHDFKHKISLYLQNCTIKMKMTLYLEAQYSFQHLKTLWAPQSLHQIHAIILLQLVALQVN